MPYPTDKPDSSASVASSGSTPALVDVQRLKQYPFLAACSEIVLKKLQPNLSEQRFDPGQTILRMGSYTDAAYYLEEGLVNVRMSSVNSTMPPGSPGVPRDSRARPIDVS